MKRFSLILGLILAFTVGNAQNANKPTNQQKAHTQAMRMQKNLTLTGDQTVKCEAVLLSKIEAIEAVKKDNAKTEPVKSAEIQKIKDQKDVELSAILTPEQYASYLNKRAEAKARRESAGGRE